MQVDEVLCTHKKFMIVERAFNPVSDNVLETSLDAIIIKVCGRYCGGQKPALVLVLPVVSITWITPWSYSLKVLRSMLKSCIDALVLTIFWTQLKTKPKIISKIWFEPCIRMEQWPTHSANTNQKWCSENLKSFREGPLWPLSSQILFSWIFQYKLF